MRLYLTVLKELPMRMLRLLPLCFLLLLTACAKQPSLPAVNLKEADAVWERYLGLPESTSPYRINLSLRYGPKDDTRRVTALLWSNGTGPVRLDVMAGMNSLAVRLFENGRDFKALSPRENKAWVYTGSDPSCNSSHVLINFGLPLPFGLTHMADLLQGNFARVFDSEHSGMPQNAGNGAIRYTLYGRFAGELDLAPDGLPLTWTGGGWHMKLAYDEAYPTRPDKVTLTHDDGVSAILLIKTRENPDKPYTAQQLQLDIPEGVEIKAITPKKE